MKYFIINIKRLILIALALATNSSFAQFFGGTDDGYGSSSALIPINVQSYYCKGGSNDGLGFTGFEGSLNIQYHYCNGGESDGFISDKSIPILFNEQSIYTFGGSGDGFTSYSSNTLINEQILYCSGAEGDGFSVGLGIQSVNDQSFYCFGGNEDGFSQNSYLDFMYEPVFLMGSSGDGFEHGTILARTLNEQDFYCNGGYADGFDLNSFNGIFYPLISFHGGFGDGFDLNHSNAGSFNQQDFYCNGGFADGFDKSSYSGIFYPLLCFNGGSGDGFNADVSLGLTLGNGIWLGSVDWLWTKSSNWQNGVIPDYQTPVWIPSGKPNYPITNTMSIGSNVAYYECASMHIDTNANLRSLGDLLIFDQLVVDGTLLTTSSRDSNIRIENKGHLIIRDLGEVKVGDRTSSPANSDLIVFNGGKLSVLAGDLYVDDQFVVKSGGEMQMTDGSMILHQAGYGSDLSASSYSPFYIENGALGFISGGDVQLTGKPSIGAKHALMIHESLFSFTDSSNLYIVPARNGLSYECGLFTVNGSKLNNLTIDNPSTKTYIKSNVVVDKKVQLLRGNLLVDPGKHLRILNH